MRSVEAVAVLQSLDDELAASAKSAGKSLVWTAADQQIRELIADTIDRKVDLSVLYDATVDISPRVKLCAEIRLLEGSLARLLKMIQTDIPKPETLTTIKARRASQARWDRERHATG